MLSEHARCNSLPLHSGVSRFHVHKAETIAAARLSQTGWSGHHAKVLLLAIDVKAVQLNNSVVVWQQSALQSDVWVQHQC